ncbi:beta-galactosidase [bacterium]|nr:beta-galactosidase [bacterium]
MVKDLIKWIWPVSALVLLSAPVISQPARLKSPDPLPILAWLGPPAEHTIYSRYREMADAGFNQSFSGFPDADAMAKALDIAKAANVKLFISIPELSKDPEGIARRFKNHPALAGYYLRDEPNAKDFPDLAAWVKRIRAVDDEHFCYINLFPNYATAEQLGTPTYREYVDEFVRTIPVQVITFDHYPVIGDKLRPEWYENLEIISAASRKANKPFWAFALAVAHDPYPVPTLSHLRVQIYSDLAYGAQGIQYFTYWTPRSTTWNFHQGPIETDGKRTVVYERVKQINEEIQNLAGVFIGAKVLSVGHSGPVLPRGTKPFTVMPPFTSIENFNNEESALISWLENGGRQFLVIVNSNIKYDMQFTINTEKDAAIQRVQKDGTLESFINTGAGINIGPGDVVIFTWEKSKSGRKK